MSKNPKNSCQRREHAQTQSMTIKRALKIRRQKNCARTGAAGEVSQGHIFKRNLQPRDTVTIGRAPSQDRPTYSSNHPLMSTNCGRRLELSVQKVRHHYQSCHNSINGWLPKRHLSPVGNTLIAQYEDIHQ